MGTIETNNGTEKHMKARIARNTMNLNENRGSVYMTFAIADESLENDVIKAMGEYGFACPVVEDSDYYDGGTDINYMIYSDEVQGFKEAAQIVKKRIK